MTTSLPPVYPATTWFVKGCECTLAIIGVLNVLMTGLEFVPDAFWIRYGQYAQNVLLGIVVVSLLGGITYAWIWHRQERDGRVSSGARHAWLQGIIRYWLAFEISTYGFAKLFKTQFDTPPDRFDMPVGDLSGFQLTWFYYGYSYTLAVIIALLQIGGCLLLLYRRTTLLGVMILLPVMVNIVLINLFYTIALGALYNSLVFTLGLLFLLALDWPKLKRAFWDIVDRLPPVVIGRHWIKPFLRLLPLLAAFGMIQVLAHDRKKENGLVGAWAVKQLTRNGQRVSSTAWLTDTTAWNRLYFTGWQEVALSPNPYRYKPAEGLRGRYEYDSTTNGLRLLIARKKNDPKPDTLRATLSERTQKTLRIKGVWWGDTLDLQLTRLR
ncbi:hypothetical protein [Fibrella aestuarina]|nr:hypothetical protein [Fibrella aestuarina]